MGCNQETLHDIISHTIDELLDQEIDEEELKQRIVTIIDRDRPRPPNGDINRFTFSSEIAEKILEELER